MVAENSGTEGGWGPSKYAGCIFTVALKEGCVHVGRKKRLNHLPLKITKLTKLHKKQGKRSLNSFEMSSMIKQHKYMSFRFK
jgi:hypothetical protein